MRSLAIADQLTTFTMCCRVPYLDGTSLSIHSTTVTNQLVPFAMPQFRLTRSPVKEYKYT